MGRIGLIPERNYCYLSQLSWANRSSFAPVGSSKIETVSWTRKLNNISKRTTTSCLSHYSPLHDYKQTNFNERLDFSTVWYTRMQIQTSRYWCITNFRPIFRTIRYTTLVHIYSGTVYVQIVQELTHSYIHIAGISSDKFMQAIKIIFLRR